MKCTETKYICHEKAKSTSFNSLTEVVEEYINYDKTLLDQDLDHYSSKKNTYKQVVTKASAFENHIGRKHSHQWRIKNIAMKALEAKLKVISEQELQQFKKFEELFNFLNITLSKIPGIGPLTIYDTATRLGSFLELSPDFVYLHAGTREGTRNLLGKNFSVKKYLSQNDFPKEFSKLTPDQIENLLCIYKEKLNPKLIT